MRLIDKAVNKHSLWRISIMGVMLVAVFLQFIYGVVYAMSKQVSIVDGHNKIDCYVTHANKIAEVLANEGIELSDGDEVTPALNTRVTDGQTIKIARAKNITLIDGKNTFALRTTAETVSELLTKHGTDISAKISVNAQMDDEIYEGMNITVTYLDEKTVTEETEIPYKTTKKETTAIEEGSTRVITEGKNGTRTDTYKVYYENSDEVSRELISKVTKTSPVDEVVEVGVSKNGITHHSGSVVSRSGGTFRYKSYIDCSATAYDLSYASCGKNPGQSGYGVTASGMRAQYGVVAVDPRVIPLGTRLYIEAADGSWSYGNAVAGDTGGAIRGNKIDLFFNSNSECRSFGRRTARVYILE